MNKLDVIIGIDFGTASTKVVMQTPYSYERRSVPVDFKSINSEYNYLLPSQIFLSPNGNFSIKQKDNYQLENNFKFRLLKTKKSLEDLIKSRDGLLVTAFLAFTISHSKKWFIDNQKNLYPNLNFRWSYNIGIPSNGYDDENQTLFYRSITSAAEKISEDIESITIDDLQNKIIDLVKNIPENIQVVPEVISEAIGYARSSERNPGLHFLIDIGASTLDLTSFILAENEGDDAYTILYADVIPLGTLELHRLRQRKIFFDILSWYHLKMTSIKSYEPIPDKIEDYFPDEKYIKSLQLIDYEKDFVEKCKTKISAMVFQVYKNRDPYSPKWKEGLPLFICGGGSHLKVYEKIVEFSNNSILIHLKDVAGFKIKKLVKPKNLYSNDPEMDYTRLAVAYGLSTPYDDIGKVKPQYKVGDIVRNRSNKFDNTPSYYDKDMV